MPIRKETANGIPNPRGVIEKDVGIPWASDPIGSYVYYDCSVGCMLDSGIVVHNRLPQVNRVPDSLSSVILDSNELSTVTDRGVNLTCKDQYADIVQRMGHARYWFRLWGQALRVGYKVPIPGIKLIGGVPAIPYDKNPQWGFNSVAPLGNYGGVILWRAVWSLWFTTSIPPTNNTIPQSNPAALVNETTKPPKEVQAPYSRADEETGAIPQALPPGGPVRV